MHQHNVGQEQLGRCGWIGLWRDQGTWPCCKGVSVAAIDPCHSALLISFIVTWGIIIRYCTRIP
ncbi:hypothetical protein BDW66DRAFT_126467 [Aspergillus desertorum]